MINKLNALYHITAYIVIRYILTLLIEAIDKANTLAILNRYTGLNNPVDNITIILAVLGMITTLILEIKRNN